MSSRFIHIVACDRISFLVKAELYFIIYITFCSFILAPKRLLNCFHLLLTVNSAVMKRGMQIPLQDLGFNYFGYIYRSGITESLKVLFLILGENSMLFCILLQPHHSEQGFQFLHILENACCCLSLPHPPHRSHPKCVRCCFVVRLICISLIISDADHLLKHMMAICILSLEKYLFKSSAHFYFYFFLILFYF